MNRIKTRITILLLSCMVCMLSACLSEDGTTILSSFVAVISTESAASVKIPYEQYMESCGVSKPMKEMLRFVNQPVEEVVSVFGNSYTITSSDPSVRTAMQYYLYRHRLRYDQTITPLTFDVSVQGGMMAGSDLVWSVGTGQTGFELAPGIVIGESAAAIAAKAGAEFPINGEQLFSCSYSLNDSFSFTFEFVDGFLRYVYLTGTGVYQKTVAATTPKESDDLKAKLKAVLDYYYARGLTQFAPDKFTYRGTEYIKSSGGTWDVWECSGFDSAAEAAVLRIEQRSPHRVFLDWSNMRGLLWMDGQYVHPVAYTQGRWSSSENPAHSLVIRSITQEGELIFDLNLGEVSFKGLGSFLTEIQAGSYNHLFGMDFEAHFDYYDGYSTMGLMQYSGATYGNNASIGFSRSRSQIVVTGLGTQVITFDTRLSGDFTVYTTNSPGVLQWFGEDDPEWNKHFKQGNSASAGEKQVFNDYLNTIHKTNGLDYAGREYVFRGQYYFEEGDRTYAVWDGNREGGRFFVDKQSQTVIVSWQEGSRLYHTKEIPWCQGKRSSSTNAYAGIWKGKGVTLEIGSTDGNQVPLQLQMANGLLSEWTGTGELVEGIWDDESQERIIGFNFLEGDLNISGYIHLNPRTLGACLYINGSNVTGIPCGVYKIGRDKASYPWMIDLSGVAPQESEEPASVTQGEVIRTEYIRDFYGHIQGRVEYLENGDKIARDFYGAIKGRYFADENVTKDFYGRIISKGDSLVSLLFIDK